MGQGEDIAPIRSAGDARTTTEHVWRGDCWAGVGAPGQTRNIGHGSDAADCRVVLSYTIDID